MGLLSSTALFGDLNQVKQSGGGLVVAISVQEFWIDGCQRHVSWICGETFLALERLIFGSGLTSIS
jgi:hypothetical protein